MSTKKASEKESPHDFERSLKRLEEIVHTLEQGSASLEESIKLYEEGVGISKECLEFLHQAELTLKRLTKDAGGSFKLLDGIEE
jgi:exodeoxyribonuclease VII small subunit